MNSTKWSIAAGTFLVLSALCLIIANFALIKESYQPKLTTEPKEPAIQ